MKRLFKLLLIVLLVSGVVYAGDVSQDAKESKMGTISATATASATIINRAHLILVNRGSNEVFIRFNSDSVATTSDFELRNGESAVFDSTPGKTIYKVGTICSTAETATIAYIAWD